jgi:protein disulfide-isomerase
MKSILSFFVTVPFFVFAEMKITEDYSKAKEIAQDHNLPILILFTGSDWSMPSQEVIGEINTSEFASSIENQFILVQADYPELNNQKVEFLKQNSELKEKYQIETFPTVVMTDVEGREITRLGAMKLEPKQFAEHLRDLYLKYTLLHRGMKNLDFIKNSVQAIEELYKSARELKCPHYVEKLMNVGIEVNEGVFFLLEKYNALVRSGLSKTGEAISVKEKIVQRDPENKEMGQLRLALLEFQSRDGEDPNQATEPLGAYISHFGGEDKENLSRLHLIISDYFKDHSAETCSNK